MEDTAHEKFITSVVGRIASEAGIDLELEIRSATGGIPRMRSTLRRFLRDYSRIDSPEFDILIIVEDTDCRGVSTVRNEILQLVERERYRKPVIAAVPNPHIEIWYLADPNALQYLLNLSGIPRVPQGDCEKGKYKRELADLFSTAPLGGVEYADDIVAHMDLYKAGKSVSSLGAFIDETRSELNRLATDI